MNIKKITDAEIEAASVRRLSSRPNEARRFGERAMTAEELKDAFDALGRLNATHYNALAELLSNGFADGTIGHELRLQDGHSVASHIEAMEEKEKDAEAFFMPIKPLPFSYNTALYRAEAFHCQYINGGVTVYQGSYVNKHTPIVVKLGSFPITKGRLYYVRLQEHIPALFSVNSDHITDGGRLRIQLDYGSDGSENEVAKLNAFGTTEKTVRYTDEPVYFEAKESGTAHITLSVYHNEDALAMPWRTSDVTLTPEVFVSEYFPTKEDGDAYILALDKNFKASWFRFTSFHGNLSNTYTKSEINQKIDALTKAILALGGQV